MMGESTPAVAVTGLTMSYRNGNADRIPVLDDVSFQVAVGEIVGLFGPSGCGKSTLLRILCGVLSQQRGEVQVLGHPRASRSGVFAYVPQHPHLLDWRTLQDNSLLGWNLVQRRKPDRAVLECCQALFERFGISAIAEKYPRHCSGGERQRAALVRALLTPAPILALDEPAAAIDQITRVGIYETLLEVVQETESAHRVAILTVSHDPEELLLLCDRILVLSPRPARLREVIGVPFPRPRDPALRFTPEFLSVKRRLWETLS